MRHVAETTKSDVEAHASKCAWLGEMMHAPWARFRVVFPCKLASTQCFQIKQLWRKRGSEALYQSITWPLYRIFGHAFDAFKIMVADNGAAIVARLEEDKGGPIEPLTEEVKEALLKNVKRRMTPQPLKV
eukprot:365807-Chlamydomonas_euryale.AAC.13